MLFVELILWSLFGRQSDRFPSLHLAAWLNVVADRAGGGRARAPQRSQRSQHAPCQLAGPPAPVRAPRIKNTRINYTFVNQAPIFFSFFFGVVVVGGGLMNSPGVLRGRGSSV